jgi:hypothetical protein
VREKSFSNMKCPAQTIVSRSLHIAGLLSVLILTSCTSYRPFRTTSDSSYFTHNEKYDLGFVEMDDEGWYWSPKQAATVLSNVKEVADKKGVMLVLFTHGWK